jgi:ribosomal-protein-alanine N-acetyltransferase
LRRDDAYSSHAYFPSDSEGFRGDDVERLYGILSNSEVLRYVQSQEPWSLEDVERWVSSQREHWCEHGLGWFALEHRQESQLIGWCGMRLLAQTEEVEVLYLLDEAYWGQGLATEAASRCVEDGFRQHGLDLIIGLTYAENVASRRVLEKAGLLFSNEARYFDIDCLRYTIDRQRFEGFYGEVQ